MEHCPKTLDVTLYFKRGNVCQKESDGIDKTFYNHFKMELIKDIRMERFDHFMLIELPQTLIKLLPYYVLVALWSHAAQKSVLLEDGSCIPMTPKFLIHITSKLVTCFLKLVVVLPLVIVNLGVLIFLSVIVDLLILLGSGLVEDWSRGRANQRLS
jgi:hypothetical protein